MLSILVFPIHFLWVRTFDHKGQIKEFFFFLICLLFSFHCLVYKPCCAMTGHVNTDLDNANVMVCHHKKSLRVLVNGFFSIFCLFLWVKLLISFFFFVVGSYMRGKSVLFRVVRSLRPHRLAAVQMSTTALPHPSAYSLHSAAHPPSSPRTHWLWLTSASSSQTRARLLLTLSVKWTRTSTVAWWVQHGSHNNVKNKLCCYTIHSCQSRYWGGGKKTLEQSKHLNMKSTQHG